MLFVCALALVVAAAVFLVLGLAAGDVGDLYLSMVLCVSSLVVAAVSSRLSRPTPAPRASEPPVPVVPAGADDAEADAPAVGVASARVGAAEPVVAEAVVADPTAGLGDRLAKRPPASEPAPVDDGSIWAATPTSPPPPAPAPEPPVQVEPEPQVEPEAASDEEAPFPIADYDDLAAEQILPLVPKLWPEEVPLVAARERATKARPAVLDALAEAGRNPALAFPIAEYESLDTAQITRLLEQLDAADLVTVQVAERSGPARVGVLVAVANQLAART